MLSGFASQLLSKATDSDPLFFSFTTQNSSGGHRRVDYDDGSDESDEEIELGGAQETTPPHPQSHAHDSPFIDPEPQRVGGHHLQESLLQDAGHRPFSLPRVRDLNLPLSAVKYIDPGPAILFVISLGTCLVLAFVSLFTHSSSHWTSRGFLATFVPLITLLPTVAALWSYASIAIMAVLEKQIVIIGAVLNIIIYFTSALMAFIGSFELSSSAGAWLLRLMSLPLLASSIHRGLLLPPLLASPPTASAPLTLSINLLRQPAHTRLILLSPLLLLLSITASLPILLLLGRTERWFTALLVLGALIWTWGVCRGISRAVSSTMLGAWYHVPRPSHPAQTLFSLSIHRATKSNLGSISLSAGISLFSNVLLLASSVLSFLSWIIPGSLWARPAVIAITWCIRFIDQTIERWTRGAVIIVGMRGSSFLTSLHAAPRRSPLHIAGGGGAIVFIPAFLVSYLSLSNSTSGGVLYPSLLVALLTTLSARTATGLVGDVCDTLGVCYALDLDRSTGENDSDEDDSDDDESGEKRERRAIVRAAFTSAAAVAGPSTSSPARPSGPLKPPSGAPAPFLPEFLSSDSDSADENDDDADLNPYHQAPPSPESSPDSDSQIATEAHARERARLNEFARRQQVRDSSLMDESEDQLFPSDLF